MEHDGCKGCKYENYSMESKECSGCTQNATDKYTRMTNADCIRAMSDEEIADFILENCDNPISEVNEDMCDYCSIFEEDKGCDSDYCKKALIKWLQTKVEE